MAATFVAVCAVLLDRWLGEPPRLHPLVGFGRIASAIEVRFNSAVHTPLRQRLYGIVAVALLLLPVTLVCMLVVDFLVMGTFIAIAVLYLTLGGQSLTEHARRVAAALRGNNLDTARLHVSHMVSRDTGAMEPHDVARATVESVLENGNDAVFGTLFWFIVAGAPGAVVYRLANTLDAMWGYRTPRYFYFGWAAARLDDVMNFVPARLTALTYAVLGQRASALRCWRAQGHLWGSPNAGPVMAAGAGALGIQLGGPAFYHGAWKERPALGAGLPATTDDIERAVQLVWRGTGLWLTLFIAISVGVVLLA